ncbi:relaxase/mobilization nuclease domain-containing protein [Salmonirosea aquatica]|uniref:Relaxase/mobilization nuclease domain-containing protein n=1 Tax=Salmonirosea aquatica TaxID=2654236 RepID=A0A7C9FC52_9BACT|nr:relaxase/mobilization nuclease domain-containing protein [Cytophagaceae bacterium SJW1-29]
MIGKIGKSGQDFLGVLSYCKYDRAVSSNKAASVRGELIYHQHINVLLFGDKVPLDIIADEMKSISALNSRTRKLVCHVSLSFPPGERPDRQTLRDIVMDFAGDFGFRENGLLAFRHTDKAHEHIHIIANKIDARGVNSAVSSYNYLEMGRFCRRVEIKYDLQQVKHMDALKRDSTHAPKMTSHHVRLREAIDELIPECNNLHTLQVRLLKLGYKSVVEKGIAFVCKRTGTKIKASSLGWQYAKTSLIERINNSFKFEEGPIFTDRSGHTNEVKRPQLEKQFLSPKKKLR